AARRPAVRASPGLYVHHLATAYATATPRRSSTGDTGECVLGYLASPVFAFAARAAGDRLEVPVPALSQHREVVLLRRADGAECDRLVEGDEPAVVCGGQCEQVGVGDLLGPVHPAAVDEGAVEHADRARPELVVIEARGAGEQVHRLAWWGRGWDSGA